MSCDDVRAILDAYWADELEAGERQAVTAHLASCSGCRAEAQAWGELFERTRALPRSIEPPRDLWPGIDAARGKPSAVVPLPRRHGRLGPLWLVAAAVALVVVTAAITSLLQREWDTAVARKLKAMGPPAATAPATEAEYRAVTEELLRSLEAQDLPPETMAIVHRNVAVIDAAILELREALARDPADADLTRLLLAAYQRKLELLEQAVRAGEEG